MIASTFACLPSAPAWAQDIVEYPDPEIDVAAERIDDTIVVSGTWLPLIALPRSVASLSDTDLARLQSLSVADVLGTIPGVSATRNGPVGGFTGLRIRGADAAHTLVVIDGVRVGDPTSPGGGFDFGSLLSGGIARIDVLRGSNSTVWGSDAIGGVVLVESGGADGVSAEYGSHDSIRIDGRQSVDLGKLSIAVGGGWFDTSGISSARSGIEADGFRQYRGHARVRAELSSTIKATASVIFADSRLEIDGFAPPTYSFGDTAEYQNVQELYTAASLEHQVGSSFSHKLSFSLADINRDTFDPAFGSAPSFAARGRSEHIEWQGRYGNLLDPISAVVGVGREWTRAVTGGAFSSDSGRTAISGIFGHAVIRPSDVVELGLGARHDDHRRFGGNTSLSAHALYEVSSALAVRTSYSEGYKAPTLFQLSPTASGFGNPLLWPEEIKAYDVGFIYRRSRAIAGNPPVGIRVEASLFRRDSRNLIDFVSCAGAGAPAICAGGTRPFGTYANVDRARASGGELEITLWPTAGLQFNAGYAYIATHDRSTGQASFGNRLARRPVHSAILGGDWDGGRFLIGGDVRLVGDSFDDAGNFTRLDGYALVSLRGSFELTETVELYGRVENLFDADYQNVAGYGTYGRTFSVGARARF
ncbi:MAG: TonB-dependent receptor [Sphingopyxis sp.]